MLLVTTGMHFLNSLVVFSINVGSTQCKIENDSQTAMETLKKHATTVKLNGVYD